MTGPDRRDLGRVFNEVPELYDRVRPAYPDQLFADLAAITGMNRRSPVLEVGCGTGQATRSLAALGNQLGGDDFNDLLYARLAGDFEKRHGVSLKDEAAARTRLWWAAEEAKKQLSFEPRSEVDRKS